MNTIGQGGLCTRFSARSKADTKQLQRELISTQLGYKHTGCANGKDRHTGNWKLWALLWLTNHFVKLNTCTTMRSIEVWLKWVSISSGTFVHTYKCMYVLGDVIVIMSSLLCCCRRERGTTVHTPAWVKGRTLIYLCYSMHLSYTAGDWTGMLLSKHIAS